MCPPAALHVLERRWLPGPQTPAYGGQTKEPALQCVPQLGLCWSGQQSLMRPHALCRPASLTLLNSLSGADKLKIGGLIRSIHSNYEKKNMFSHLLQHIRLRRRCWFPFTTGFAICVLQKILFSRIPTSIVILSRYFHRRYL